LAYRRYLFISFSLFYCD